MASFLRLLFFVPFGLLGLGFALSNRNSVAVAFDPFAGDDKYDVSISLPLYLIVFSALIFGVILGSVATWLSQGRSRRKTRAALTEVERLRADLVRAKGRQENDKRVALFHV